MHSVELAQQPPAFINTAKKYQRSSYPDDFNLYDTFSSGKSAKDSYGRAGNHKKKWTKEDEELMKQSHLSGQNFKEIAAQLGRAINGVRMKLMEMGLLDKDFDF